MPSQNISINFSQGLNTKVDPWQLPPGQFLSLQNAIFTTNDLLSKRNGYGFLPGASPPSAYLTTLNDNLLSIGNTINAYSTTLSTFITKGALQPCSLSVLPLIRNNVNQVQTDTALANGVICITYTQSIGTLTGTVLTYLYAIEDAETGQNVVPPTAIPVLTNGAINGSSRIFIVGNFFVIVSPVIISGTTFLQYVSIPLINPLIISPAQNTYPDAYVPLTNQPGWDGVVVDNTNATLVLAYNTTAGGQGVHVTILTEAQIRANSPSSVVHAFSSAALYKAGAMSVCADETPSKTRISEVVYISFWNPTTTVAWICAVYISFNVIVVQFNPTILASGPIANLASDAQNGICTVMYEVVAALPYDNTIPDHLILSKTCTNAGVVGNALGVVSGAGLASKAFIVNSNIYFLCAYQSPFQPSYFLINATSTLAQPLVYCPTIVAKLAYQNGGGYLTLGLPSVTVIGSVASVSYLFKQNVQALNTLSNPEQTSVGGIYSQLGINFANFEIGTQAVASSEIAKNLHLSGGFLSTFDGFYPVEHNFFLFPDSVKVTYTEDSTVSTTGSCASGSFTITLASTTNMAIGMTITDTTNSYIPANTTIVYINGLVVTMSAATTNAISGDTIHAFGNIKAKPDDATNTNAYAYIVTYEWTDMQGNAYKSTPSVAVFVTTAGTASTGTVLVQFPMLRLTQKIVNYVKAVVYRWSVETQVYNQVTTINSPILNNPSNFNFQSLSFVDTYSDPEIIGNNLLYTTGGVVPDVNGPATNILTVFDTRLVLIPAEDPNTILVSKTVIEQVPIEMCLDFTIYIAPNIGTTGTSGPITAAFPLDDKLILFKQNSMFYINGVGPDNLGTTSAGCSLGNYSQPIFITSVVGCTNQQSIVLTQDGIMFQSDKGIWLLSRQLQVSYIGAPVQAFNQSNVNSARVIPNTNYILFTLDTGEALMYDYYMGMWGTFIGIPAVSSCIYNDLHTILTPYGQILQETPGVYQDGNQPVLLGFTTSWLNLASLQGYERFKRFYILAKYISPHLLNINLAYDYNPSSAHQIIISPHNAFPIVPSAFGVPVPFGSGGYLEQWKADPKRQLCQSFQLSIQEVYDPTQGLPPGAGFTMSGINCEVEIKKATRPIPAASSAG